MVFAPWGGKSKANENFSVETQLQGVLFKTILRNTLASYDLKTHGTKYFRPVILSVARVPAKPVLAQVEGSRECVPLPYRFGEFS
jgi:hypothetical protein